MVTFLFFHSIFFMDTGVIKKLLNGFGFISREGSDDLFFHSADLVGVSFDDLQEGDKVQFKVGSGPKGPKADEVSKAGEASGESEEASGDDEKASEE